MHDRPPSVIAVVGWKNSGKTTLVVRLIEELVRRGLRVATVKHAHHGLRLDDPGADSARHARAGARQAAVVSPGLWAIGGELHEGPEPPLAELIARLDPCDVVIVEGYKSEPIPKIEVRRRASASKEPLAGTDPLVIAIAADHAIDGEQIPVFALDDVGAIADFIVRRNAEGAP